MRNPDPKPIRTTYNGVHFRSRTEARWAVFFDALGVRWQYEHEGYELPSGRYLPDFWLPDVSVARRQRGCFIEIKPSGAPTERERKLMEELCEQTDRDVVMFCGAPALLPDGRGDDRMNLWQFSGAQGNGTVYTRQRFPIHNGPDRPTEWEWCPINSGCHNFTLIEDEPHIRYLNGDCDTDHASGEWNRNHRHPRILAAIHKATTTSFWEPKR